MKHLVIAACVVVLSAGSLHAQAPGDADAKEIQSYRLTVPALNQFATVIRNVLTSLKSDPRFGQMMKLRAELEQLEKKDELTDAEGERLDTVREEIDALEEKLPTVAINASDSKSLSEMEAAMSKEPIMAKALKDAGMTARDYAKFTVAFFQAAMVHGMQKSGIVKEVPPDLQAAMNMDNLKFIESHQAEITKLMAELQALSAQ